MTTDLSNGEKRRGPRGQFAKGNPGGPGRSKGSASQTTLVARELRAAVFAAVTETDMREVIGAIVAKAKSGDVVAARLVLDYTIGKPRELDAGPQGRPIEIVVENDVQLKYAERLMEITGGVAPTPEQNLEALECIPTPDYAKPDYNASPNGPDLGIAPVS